MGAWRSNYAAARSTLPLWIGEDLAVPLELESTYLITWEMLRLED